MKFLRNIFRKKPDNISDVTALAKEIGILLDTTAGDIFVAHRETLLTEEIVYIVYAVWGAKKGGELNSEQMDIHRKITPVIIEVEKKIGLQSVTHRQKYAVESLIRSVLINRITFMIAHYKDTLTQRNANLAADAKPGPVPGHDIDDWLSNISVSEVNPWWKRMRFNGDTFDEE